MLVAQTAFSLIVVMVAVLIAVVSKGSGALAPGHQLEQFTSTITPLLLIGGVISGGAVSYALARAWLWNPAVDPTGESFGWRKSGRWQVLTAALTGVVLGSSYLYGAMRFFPPAPGAKVGPLGQAAAHGGASRFTVAFLAVVIAPPIEEFLFRGVLLRGFARSWGFPISAIVVSVSFLLMHVFEFVHYWPGAAAIAALTVGTLIARRLSGSLVPPVALHAGYNLALMVFMYSTL